MLETVVLLSGVVFVALVAAELALVGHEYRYDIFAALLVVFVVATGGYYALYAADAGGAETVEGEVVSSGYVFEGCIRGALCEYDVTLRYTYEVGGESYSSTDLVFGESPFRLEEPGETTVRSREEAESWVTRYDEGDTIRLHVDADDPRQVGPTVSFLRAKMAELLAGAGAWFFLGGLVTRVVGAHRALPWLDGSP
jgi:hypothetical protein